MALKSKAMLSRLKMPKKKDEEDLDLPDMGDEEEDPMDHQESRDMEEGSPEEEASESPEEEKKEEELGEDLDQDNEEGEPESHKEKVLGSDEHRRALEECSDEDLMAEMKKRGLMHQLSREDGKSSDEPESMDMY